MYSTNLSLIRPWTTGGPPKEVLLSILGLSHRFMMDSGVNWAIQAFDNLDSDNALTPASRLRLAFQYEIQQWILPAISTLIDQQNSRKQLRLIMNESIDQMGWRTYIIISKAIETIQAARSAVAITPPTVHHAPSCRKEQECNRVWIYFWLTTVLRRLFAADNPMSLASLPSFLQLESIRDFGEACKTLTLLHFNDTEVLKIESSVKEQASSRVWDLYQEGLM